MKQFILAVLAIAFFSCSGGRKQGEAIATVFSVDSLFTVADQKLNDTIKVTGFVTHVCKHSGQKCFIVGESQKVSLLVLTGGEIETFPAELIGSKLVITGVLKEGEHVTHQQIEEKENSVKLQQQGGAAPETCETELRNIADMRQWMKDHQKDYYAMYYMEGLKFNVVE